MTEFQTVVTNQTKDFAIQPVVNIVSNVDLLDVVFQIRGNATVITTVLMVRMKILLYVIHANAIETHNSDAKMENVYRNYGSVILMTTAAITLTNRRTDAEIEIVALDGKSVPQETTIDVFPVGFSAMAKMIVVIILMKLIQNSVPNVTTSETSNAKMESVFHFVGDATLKMIVEIRVMRTALCALTYIENVLKVSFNAVIKNVYLRDGVAITTTTAMTALTRKSVSTTDAKMISSSAEVDIVYHRNSFVMEIKTVKMCPTKLIVRHVSLMADIVRNHYFSAIIQSVCDLTFYVMATMTAAMEPMN